jgi:hypothetical protein
VILTRGFDVHRLELGLPIELTDAQQYVHD